jgi:hypothetical protein
MEEIAQRIEAAKNPLLIGSLQFILAEKTGDLKWASAFTKTLAANPEAFSARWFESMFTYRGQIDDALLQAIAPTVGQLAANEDLPPKARFAAIQFYNAWPNSWTNQLFRHEDFRNDENLWRAVTFLITAAKGGFPNDIQEYQRTATLDLLAIFDLAAAHVVSSVLLEDTQLGEGPRSQIENFLDARKASYPAFQSAPLPELVEFWTSPDLLAVRDGYDADLIDSQYRYAE